MVVEGKACCHVSNAFLSRLEPILPVSSLEISKLSKKCIFGKKLWESMDEKDIFIMSISEFDIEKGLTTKITLYYMATIARVLWLAAERALFSCNDRALWNFSRLNGSFELWVKLHARGRKQRERWTKYNYIFHNWKKN